MGVRHINRIRFATHLPKPYRPPTLCASSAHRRRTAFGTCLTGLRVTVYSYFGRCLTLPPHEGFERGRSMLATMSARRLNGFRDDRRKRFGLVQESRVACAWDCHEPPARQMLSQVVRSASIPTVSTIFAQHAEGRDVDAPERRAAKVLGSSSSSLDLPHRGGCVCQLGFLEVGTH